MNACSSLSRVLWPLGEAPERPQVYAVLDGARDRAVLEWVRASNQPHECLYAGPLTPALQAASPHLVRLTQRGGLFEDLVEKAWGRAWGILAVAGPDVGLPVLRRHFRNLLRLTLEDGRRVLFRFYDPRVLRTFVRNSQTVDTAAALLGPMQRLVYEPAEGNMPLTLERRPDAVHPDGPSTIRVGPALLLVFEHEKRVEAIQDHYRVHLASEFGMPAHEDFVRWFEAADRFGLTDHTDVASYVFIFGALNCLDDELPAVRAQVEQALLPSGAASPSHRLKNALIVCLDSLARADQPSIRSLR